MASPFSLTLTAHTATDWDVSGRETERLRAPTNLHELVGRPSHCPHAWTTVQAPSLIIRTPPASGVPICYRFMGKPRRCERPLAGRSSCVPILAFAASRRSAIGTGSRISREHLSQSSALKARRKMESLRAAVRRYADGRRLSVCCRTNGLRACPCGGREAAAEATMPR